MKNLKAKLRKNGGFTLIEMLIVVAIIAILVAISIPLVGSALERAREATDAANERAALGIAMVEVMSENKLAGQTIGEDSVTARYMITSSSEGSLVTTAATSLKAYGKGTASGEVQTARTGQVIEITYNPKATTGSGFTVGWVAGGASNPATP